MNDLWAFILNERPGIKLHHWYYLSGAQYPTHAASSPGIRSYIDEVYYDSGLNYPSGRYTTFFC